MEWRVKLEDPLWHEASSVFSVSLRVLITRRLIFFGDPTRESGTQCSVTVKDSGTQRSVTVEDSRGQSRTVDRRRKRSWGIKKNTVPKKLDEEEKFCM